MENRPKTCCFTGHRPERLPWLSNPADVKYLSLRRALWDRIQACCDQGYTRFLTGMGSVRSRSSLSRRNMTGAASTAGIGIWWITLTGSSASMTEFPPAGLIRHWNMPSKRTLK